MKSSLNTSNQQVLAKFLEELIRNARHVEGVQAPAQTSVEIQRSSTPPALGKSLADVSSYHSAIEGRVDPQTADPEPAQTDMDGLEFSS